MPIHLCHAEVESRLGVKGLKKLVWRSCLILGSVATLSPGLVAAEEMAPAYTVSVVTDRTDALYHVGETATFVIRVLHHGQPLGEADVQWRISKNGETTIEQGSIRLENGEARVSASLSEPGFLQCRVAFQAGGAETVALAGAGVDPQDIAPSLPVPDDFDAFWASKKALLAEIPMNPRMVPVSPSAKGFEIFDVQADSIGGVPVSGYFVRPADAEPGSLPAILTLHGAGVRSAGIPTGWAKEGMLAMDINAHGVPNGKPAAYYDGLVTGSLSRYSMRGRDSRDTYYFLGMFLRVVRAIDFLASQPEWDGKTLILYGTSQGAAQSLAGSALDPRVTFFVAGVPAMADLTGIAAHRPMGWPGMGVYSNVSKVKDVLETVRYFDGMNFATRIKADGFFTVGFVDTACPPATVYAAYNNVNTGKAIYHDIAAGHVNTPEATRRMRAAVLAHVASQRE